MNNFKIRDLMISVYPDNHAAAKNIENCDGATQEENLPCHATCSSTIDDDPKPCSPVTCGSTIEDPKTCPPVTCGQTIDPPEQNARESINSKGLQELKRMLAGMQAKN